MCKCRAFAKHSSFISDKERSSIAPGKVTFALSSSKFKTMVAPVLSSEDMIICEVSIPFLSSVSFIKSPNESSPNFPTKQTLAPKVAMLLAKIAVLLPRVKFIFSAIISLPIAGRLSIWSMMISTFNSPTTTTSNSFDIKL